MKRKLPPAPPGHYPKLDISGIFLVPFLGAFFGAVIGFFIGFFNHKLINTLSDLLSYILDYAFYGALAFSITAILIYFSSLNNQYFEWRRINQEKWAEEDRETARVEKHIQGLRDAYQAMYTAYLPDYNAWLLRHKQWRHAMDQRTPLLAPLENYRRLAQEKVVHFEILWRSIETRAVLELEVKDRQAVIRMFALAFGETLARSPEMGLFRLFEDKPPFVPEAFPDGHLGRDDPLAFARLLLEAIAPVAFLKADDRFAAIQASLPPFYLPPDFPYVPKTVPLAPLPEPQKPRNPDVDFDRNGAPLSLENNPRFLRKDTAKEVSNRPQ